MNNECSDLLIHKLNESINHKQKREKKSDVLSETNIWNKKFINNSITQSIYDYA